MKRIKSLLSVIILFSSIIFSSAMVASSAAWTAPTVNFPGGSPDAPLDQGTVSQSKDAKLGLQQLDFTSFLGVINSIKFGSGQRLYSSGNYFGLNETGGSSVIYNSTNSFNIKTKGVLLPHANITGDLSSLLAGTVEVAVDSVDVVGTNTVFMTELAVGDSIKIGTKIFTVSIITDNTHLKLDSVYDGTVAYSGKAYQDSALLTINNGDGVNKLTITKSGGFKLPTGATDGHVLTSDAYGVGTWKASTGGGGGGGISSQWTDITGGGIYYSGLTTLAIPNPRHTGSTYPLLSDSLTRNQYCYDDVTPAGTYSIATAYSESSWSGGYSKYNGTEWINSGGGGLTVVTQITCSQSLKVGIGKNNPAYALDVNGTINAKTILVNGSPIAGGGSQWADVNGGISYSGGFATIDLITLSGGPGRDALILKSSTDNDASSLVTNRQKFLFWSQHLNDWADIQARNALFTSGLEVSGDILLTNGANRVIKIKNQSAEDTSGNSLTISAGDANDTIGGLSGGNLYLTGGDDPMGTKGNVFLASNGGKVCLGNTTSCISNWSEVGSGFTLTGGTANYVPLWKDANTLDISNIIQDAKGNIGIGTTAPAGTLDVNGSIYQSVGTIADSIHSSNRQKTKSIGQLTLGNDASQEEAFVGMKTQVFKGQGLEKENQADIAFYTWGNSYANSREVMRIRSSGNVGIGTTAPKQKLSIYSGNIKITNGNMYFETIAPPNPTGVPNVSCLNATSESKYLYIIYSYVTDIGGETVTAWSGQCSNYDGIGATMAVPPVGAGNIISKRIYLAKSNSEISDLKSSTFQNHLPKFHYIMDVNPNLISQNIYFSARDTGKTPSLIDTSTGGIGVKISDQTEDKYKPVINFSRNGDRVNIGINGPIIGKDLDQSNSSSNTGPVRMKWVDTNSSNGVGEGWYPYAVYAP